MRTTISPNTRRQLIQAEYGAWEDEGCPAEIPDPSERGDPNGAYFKLILERFKTRLEVRDRWEAVLAIQELEYFGSSAGFSWWTQGFGNACYRMAGEIREAFDLEDAKIGYSHSYDWSADADEEWEETLEWEDGAKPAS